MGFRERFKQWRRKQIIKAVIAEGLEVPSQRSIRQPRVTHWIRTDYTLKNSELLFSAVTRISNALSAMPIQLYKGASAVKNDLNDLVSFSPNPNITSCQFVKTLEACRCTSGNCYGLKIYNSHFILQRIDVLDPARVKPVIEKDSQELWYYITPEEGEAFYVHNFYVIHVPFISTNGYSGVNPVSVLFETLDYSDSIKEFSVKQLEQGVNAAIVLEAPANLGEQQKTDMITAFMQTYRETSGNILLLESGVTAKSMNLSPVDTKLFEVEKITRSKVAMVYNLPPHLLGDYSDTSFNSQEQQMLEFLMLTMLPIVRAYEQEFDRKLLTKEQRRRGYHFQFDMDAILRADAATQAEVDYKNVRSAINTVDEIRARKHLPALPGGIGKKAVISQDLATLEYTVNVKPYVLARSLREPAPVQEPKEDPPEDDDDE